MVLSICMVIHQAILPDITYTMEKNCIFWITMFLRYGLAILGWLCTLWAMRNCKLDKHEMVEVQKRIEEKKNELKEAEANA